MKISLLDQLTPSQQRLGLVGAIVVLTAAIVLYVLQPEFKAYQAALESRSVLQTAASQGQDVAQQLLQLESDVADLQAQLHGDMANLPEKQLEAFVIGRLQTISWRNNVELFSIEPLAGEESAAFRETLFRLELVGDYFDLFDWLKNLNAELGFVVIKNFEMYPVDNVAATPRLEASITIASYKVGAS